jgi:hypothetical protein
MDVIEHLPVKKHHPILIGLGILLLLFAGVALWLSWIAAATGLVQTPILTDLAYEKPEPIHAVSAGVPVETYVHSFVTKEVVERVQAGRGELLDRSLVLTIPDNALTASARNFAQEAGELMFDLETSQVAVDSGVGFEIYLPVKDNPLETAVVVNVWSEVDRNALSVTITDVWVGNYHMPSWVVSLVADKYLHAMLFDLNQELSRYVAISSLYFEDGSVTLAGDLNIELLELVQ